MELCKRRPERYTPNVLDACEKHVEVNLYICERVQTVEDEKQAYELNVDSSIPSLFLSHRLFQLLFSYIQ